MVSCCMFIRQTSSIFFRIIFIPVFRLNNNVIHNYASCIFFEIGFSFSYIHGMHKQIAVPCRIWNCSPFFTTHENILYCFFVILFYSQFMAYCYDCHCKTRSSLFKIIIQTMYYSTNIRWRSIKKSGCWETELVSRKHW